MSYALSAAPDATAALRALDVTAQEAVFNLLDQLALEGEKLPAGDQEHDVFVLSPPRQTIAILWLFVSHETRTLHLGTLAAAIRP